MRQVFLKVFILSFVVFYSSITYAQNVTLLTESNSNVSKGNIIKKKSPELAMLYSALLPGAGQFYNESYWKIPIIIGLAAYWGYEWNDLNNNYKDYKNLYSSSLILFPPNGFSQYKVIRDFYRNERDKFAWYLGILYFANILDAYVDANLFEFDVGDDLSYLLNHSKNISLTIRFYLLY